MSYGAYMFGSYENITISKHAVRSTEIDNSLQKSQFIPQYDIYAYCENLNVIENIVSNCMADHSKLVHTLHRFINNCLTRVTKKLSSVNALSCFHLFYANIDYQAAAAGDHLRIVLSALSTHPCRMIVGAS